mgnify:CR=1 FL=1
MSKRVPSISEAQALLKEAVEANKEELVSGLREVRSQLKDLVSVLGPNALPRDVQRELDALAKVRNEMSHRRSSTYVRVDEKIEWIRRQLSEHEGEMPKSQLLDAAKREWAERKIGQAFLDRAIAEAFSTRKEDNLTVTVLFQGGSTD